MFEVTVRQTFVMKVFVEAENKSEAEDIISNSFSGITPEVCKASDGRITDWECEQHPDKVIGRVKKVTFKPEE